MKERMKKTMNLDEKVYLLMYGKPDYISNISEIIFAKSSKSIDRTVKQLKKDKWIEENKYELPREPPDARMSTGIYYSANVKTLFDSITRDLKEKNIFLTSAEKKSLRRYLGSKSFKDLVREMTEEDGRLRNVNVNFSTVKNQLVYMSTQMIFTMRLLDRRPIRVSNAINAERWIMPPISSLGPSLCEKLRNLDPYTSSVIYSSFDDMLLIAGDVFGFKYYIPKLKKEVDIKKIRKKNTKVAHAWNDPDKGVCYEIIDE